jgi:ATP-dependent exoDNAse (exonuclease V) beta subunit
VVTAALSDQDARTRIAQDLDATLFVEAGAGSGKTRSLVDRVVALVRSGVAVREIAAITFTEKAAAELRDRIRRAFEREAAAGDERFRRALEQVDAAAISTLHAFAQRILTEHPLEARLPPNVEVLDEVASQIEFENRWRGFRERLLDDPELERTILLALAAGVTLADIRHLATVLGDNWDLVADKQRLPWDRIEPSPWNASEIIRRGMALLERCDECRNGDDKLLVHLTGQIAAYLQQLAEAPDEYELLELLRREKPSFSTRYGRRPNWPDKDAIVAELRDIGQLKQQISEEVALQAVRRIALEVADFTLTAAAERRASGRLEFHDLLVLARELLRDEQHGVEVRRALHGRYRRLLLDEFQDTDPIQVDLAVLIASEDPDAAALPWSRVAVEPGRLFFVGDPKQSIYRFRRADIEVFLDARETFGAPVVSLTTNFRTTPPIIAWVNHIFGELISYQPGSQPAYEPLAPAPAREWPPAGPPVLLLGDEHTDDPDAELLREREAADVAGAVRAAMGWQVAERVAGGDQWRQARLGDITILLPARTSLPALERALEDCDIPYRAETSSLVYATREVRELLATVRALADPTDQLALVTALRSPLFGCGDDDLVTYKLGHGGYWSFRGRMPESAPPDHPVVEALAYLRDLYEQLAWLAPSEVLDRIVRDRALFELGYAHGRPRDLWRRLRFVLDQARAWSAAEGGTLRQYVEWARMQASESARVAETILPETDDDSVRIMTIHASKGLEFPIVIMSGMTTASRGPRTRVQVAFPPGEPLGLRIGRSLVTPEFEQFEPIDEQMDYHERLRLLYVACTRAKDHLVVSLHRKQRRNPPTEDRLHTNAELLALASAGAPHQQWSDAAGGPAVGTPPARPAPLLPYAEWEDERARALQASSRRRSVGATDVARLTGTDLDDETAAGIDKGARDLDLAPWQKGRYGTAVGRAVHAVLQTIDLATGAGVDAAAAAQAAAEGVIGRESTIAELARAALAAPSVRASLDRRRWRETFVATTVGDRTLEGYIDLLYRTEAGLVVVDYKTASSTADLDTRLARYRTQGGAYALAVEAATGEPVARVVFVFLTPSGAAERELDDLDVCRDEVRAAIART